MASLWLMVVLCLAAGVSATPEMTIVDLRGAGDGDKIIFNPGGNHGAPNIAPKRSPDSPKGSPGAPNPTRVAPQKSPDSPKGNPSAPNATHVAPQKSPDSPKGNPGAPNATHVAPNLPPASSKEKQPRAFFVFGDSLVDNGNNNFLMTGARADMSPYGIDSPNHKPTGRFSNGLNIPDVISEYIGSEPILPYLSPQLKGPKLFIGANFASAGVGILNETGFQFVDILRMPLQLDYFKEYQKRLIRGIGEEKTKQLVNRALVLVSLGGNDFVNNYFLFPGSVVSLSTPLTDYVTYLLAEYRKILEKLYDLGARRVIVMSPGPLGCAPAERLQHSFTGDCAADLQAAAALFEPQLTQMILDLNAKYRADVFVSANHKRTHQDMMTNPKPFGFKTSMEACCGQGPYNGLPGMCSTTSNLCRNRDEYVFWDAFHPTERACRLIVQQMMNGTDEYMKPVNLSAIMALDSDM